MLAVHKLFTYQKQHNSVAVDYINSIRIVQVYLYYVGVPNDRLPPESASMGKTSEGL